MHQESTALPKLQFYLLRTPEIYQNGTHRAGPASAKARALLYYMVMTQQVHTRAALAALLWGDLPEVAARGNLRKVLLELGATLPELFIIDRHVVGLRLDQRYWVDAVELATQIDADGANASAEVDTLRHAIALYEGDFLQGFYVRRAPDFEAWMLTERARLRELVLQGLDRLTDLLATQGDLNQAISYARRLLTMEPWREETHRHLIQWLAQSGQRSAALAQYETCCQLLAKELDVEPSHATRELYERLLLDEMPRHAGQTWHTTTEYTLVGRKPEWQSLYTAWQKAQQGVAQFICITGEAGIGKTRFVEELLVDAEHHGHITARARAYALEGRLAYAPLADWLRSAGLQRHLATLDKVWLTEVARLLPELLAEYPDLPPPQPLTERWQRKRLFEALVRAFTGLPQPLLLLLDDLHWCDPETLEWTRYLLRSASRAKVLVVGAVRPEEVDEDHPLHKMSLQLLEERQWTVIPLPLLSAEETAVLAMQVAKRSLDTHSTNTLYLETSGNALFVIEKIRADDEQDVAAGSGTLPLHSGERAAAPQLLPPKVYAVIQARLSRLSASARRLAHLGATIGRAFTEELLALASDQEEESVTRGLEELWRRRVVREVGDHRYDFSHDQIRDGTYAEISPMQQRFLHQRVAQALQTIYAGDLQPVVGELAGHYERAALPEQAIDFYQQAASVAKQLYAHLEAVEYLKKALKVLQTLSDCPQRAGRESELLHDLGLASIAVYEYGNAHLGAAWQQAYVMAEKSGSLFQICRALYAIDTYHHHHGEWRQSLEVSQRALSLAESLDDRYLKLNLLNARAMALTHYGELESANEYLDQALLLSNPPAQPSFQWYGRDPKESILLRSAWCLWQLGFVDRSRARHDAAFALGQRQEGVTQSFISFDYSAMLHTFLRDVSRVQVLGEQMVNFGTKYESAYYQREGGVYMGWALAQQGDAQRGLALVRAGVDGHRSKGQRPYEPFWRALLAETLAQASNVDEALYEVDDALARAEEMDNYYWNAHLLKLKGDFLQRLNAPNDEVEAWYQRALATARQQRARSLELRAATARALLWRSQGSEAQKQESRQSLQEVYNWFSEGFDTADLQEAKRVLASMT